MSFKISLSQSAIDPDFLQHLDEEEGIKAARVSEREDTFTLIVKDASGAPLGYSIFGRDKGNMIVLYFARSFGKVFGPMMMKQFFGVSQVLGTPLRVHASSLKAIKAQARMFGADVAMEGLDADGVLMGIFK